MISGSFDEYEVWEESDRVYIKDPHGVVITIPKDYFEEFVSFLNGLLTGVINNEEYSKYIEAISNDARGLSTWESQFVSDLVDKYAARGDAKWLSPKQKAIVKRIYDEKVA